MKKIILSAILSAGTAALALAGTEYTGKEMKQTAVQPQCWYGDTEWDVNLWGTYSFVEAGQAHIGAPGFFFGDDRGDRYIETDHAWGGGVDVKYFWRKYFGFGFEGFLLDAKRTQFDFTGVPTVGGFVFSKNDDSRVIGSALGTFTLRYPIGCSRFAPYGWAGIGGIFGGGEKDRIVATGADEGTVFATEHTDGQSRLLGQFGGGVEFRITRHIGWTNDFSWNVVGGPENNFGMIRSGLSFAF